MLEDVISELAVLETWERLYPTGDGEVLKAQQLWREELHSKLLAQAKRNGQEQ
jgi:hypothetical protein